MPGGDQIFNQRLRAGCTQDGAVPHQSPARLGFHPRLQRRLRIELGLPHLLGKLPEETSFADQLSFADGAYVTGSDGLLQPFSGDNVTVHIGGGPVNEKIRSPLMTGIRGNLWKYVLYGTRAIRYIIRRQRQARG